MASKGSIDSNLVAAFLEDKALAAWCAQAAREVHDGTDYACVLTLEQRVLRAAYVKEEMPEGTSLEDICRAIQRPQSAFTATVREELDAQSHTLQRVDELLLQPLAETLGGSSGVRCSKCKSTEIRFEIAQTRSADEGSTVFCLCMQCQKRWRM
jgi:DNA-directed RNA polymerase subunit M/transcription elongation factor TFIIS